VPRGSVVAAVLVLAFLGPSCGASGNLSGTVRQDFLNTVYSQAPDINSYRTGAQLVSLGQAVCTDLEAGAGVQQVADRVPLVEGNVTLPTGDLGIVIAAAVGSICPQFHKLLS
jgi:hypothetical protein